MRSKKESEAINSTTTTIIGKDTLLNGGVLSGSGSVRIDGQIVCEVSIAGQLILGESGSIEGNVKAQGILLAGKMRGNINCEGNLHIVSSGTLMGDIQVGQLVVDEGGKFGGNCKMTGLSDDKLNTENKRSN